MTAIPPVLLFVLLLSCCANIGCNRASNQPLSPTGSAAPGKERPETALDTAHDGTSLAPSSLGTPSASGAPSAGSHAPATQTPQQIFQARKRLDETILSPETAAQLHEQSFVQLWDRLLRTDDRFAVLKQFQLNRLVLGRVGEPQEPSGGVAGIRIRQMGEPITQLNRAAYQATLDEVEAAGWKIVQTEWHHAKFAPQGDGPPHSEFTFEIHAAHASHSQRVIARGKLRVQWSGQRDENGIPLVDSVEAADVELLEHAAPMFAQRAVVDPKTAAPDRYPRVSPLILYDLDNDGLSEIILAGCNRVYWNRGDNNFESDDFLDEDLGRVAETGIVADFTGDGIADFVGASLHELQLRLFAGDLDGRFRSPSKICFPQLLENPHTLTAGDMDMDGDLDLFVGQWRQPYDRGSMPTPYYDANDGHPDYLLRNDGHGNFTDVTDEANLAAKRRRRSYSASFVDLDEDGDLDLMRVSDFAGLDLFLNDGAGHFRDVSDELVEERHAFGMSHTLGDYNGDGKLDIYMIGMSSTTARRLEQLGLSRPDRVDNTQYRMKMAYGNRMYLAGDGDFYQPTFRDRVARTGWSWGCTSSDFDNDGDVDIYVANGHISGKSVKDYCTRFWCHDIYEGNSQPNDALDTFYKTLMGTALGHQVSWNGYEHNALQLNRDGKDFVNAAFLLGVAFEFDARAVMSDDLNADGRRDLLVVQYDSQRFQQRLHIAINQAENGGNWVGIRLREEGHGISPIGACVTVTSGERTWIQRVVTGDSFTAQHANTVHFGLGELSEVDFIEVHWLNGTKRRLDAPRLNTYHVVRPSRAKT